MTKFITPAYVTPEKRAEHEAVLDLCRAWKARGNRYMTAKRMRRYRELVAAFGEG